MNKLFPVLLIAAILLSSTILTQQVLAKSKNHVAVDKALRKNTVGGDKMTDLCSVSITTKSNNESFNIWNNTKCSPIVIPPPPVPKNKHPIVIVDSPIKCISGLDCQMTTEISDSDGNITQITWSQQSGPIVNITILEGGMTAVFTPVVNDTYIFNVKATDNNDSSTAKDITVNVGVISPPQPPTCLPDEHLENGVCVPNPPNPEPIGNTTKVIFAGDFEGTSVFNQIKSENPDLVVANGDLFYDSNLNVYKSTFVNTFGDKQRCTIGNHDAPEDGSVTIYAEAKALCGEVWITKIGQTAIVGFNSNGDINAQLQTAKGYNYSDVNNVIISSHKPCNVFPNAHHPVESNVKAFCDGLVPQLADKNVYLVSAHNHNLASSADGKMFVSGAGGKSHYVCDTNTIWNFCNNQKYGFLEFDIDNNTGDISTKFLDTTGQVIKQ